MLDAAYLRARAADYRVAAKRAGDAVRRVLSFMVATAILALGLLFVAVELFYVAYISGWSVMGATALIALGGYWLWEDFIAPPLKDEAKN